MRCEGGVLPAPLLSFSPSWLCAMCGLLATMWARAWCLMFCVLFFAVASVATPQYRQTSWRRGLWPRVVVLFRSLPFRRRLLDAPSPVVFFFFSSLLPPRLPRSPCAAGVPRVPYRPAGGVRGLLQYPPRRRATEAPSSRLPGARPLPVGRDSPLRVSLPPTVGGLVAGTAADGGSAAAGPSPAGQRPRRCRVSPPWVVRAPPVRQALPRCPAAPLSGATPRAAPRGARVGGPSCCCHRCQRAHCTGVWPAPLLALSSMPLLS